MDDFKMIIWIVYLSLMMVYLLPNISHWRFPKMGAIPNIIHFRLRFSTINHPAMVPPWLWKPSSIINHIYIYVYIYMYVCIYIYIWSSCTTLITISHCQSLVIIIFRLGFSINHLAIGVPPLVIMNYHYQSSLSTMIP